MGKPEIKVDEKTIIIDGENAILGRLASYAAKKALEGYRVYIVNSEKVAISGNRLNIYWEFREKRERGNPYKGPFYPRRPDMVVKRVIRGMLPRKKFKGREALRRVYAFIGIPEELEKYKEKFLKLPEEYTIKKLKIPKFVYLGDLAKLFGAKW